MKQVHVTRDPVLAAVAALAPAQIHSNTAERLREEGARQNRALVDLAIAVAAAAQRRLLALGGAEPWGRLVRVGAEAIVGVLPGADPKFNKLSEEALQGILGDRDAAELLREGDGVRGHRVVALPMVAVRSRRRPDELLLTGVSPGLERAAARSGRIYARLHRRWFTSSAPRDVTGLTIVDGDAWVQRPSNSKPEDVRSALTELMEDAPAAGSVEEREVLAPGVAPGAYRDSWTQDLCEVGEGLRICRTPQRFGGARWALLRIGENGQLDRALDLSLPGVAAALPGTSNHERAWLAHLACAGATGTPAATATLRIKRRGSAEQCRLRLGVAAPAWIARSLDLLGYRETPLPLGWDIATQDRDAVREIIAPWYSLT